MQKSPRNAGFFVEDRRRSRRSRALAFIASMRGWRWPVEARAGGLRA